MNNLYTRNDPYYPNVRFVSKEGLTEPQAVNEINAMRFWVGNHIDSAGYRRNLQLTAPVVSELVGKKALTYRSAQGKQVSFKRSEQKLAICNVGNLKKASVYILSLNPGLHLGDYFALSHLYYQDLIHRNFSQQTMDFPVYFLDPKIGFHMGYDYWIGKFRELREELCKITLESRLRIQKFLSQEIALLELIPYHSKRKQVNKPILSLPSVRWMKQFVKTELVPKARSDEKLIFIMRALKNWNLPDHPNILKSKNPRNPSINPNKPDGAQILTFLREKIS